RRSSDLQGGERPLRPSGRRRRAPPHRPAAGRAGARQRPAGAHRRRGVRRAGGGHRRRRRRPARRAPARRGGGGRRHQCRPCQRGGDGQRRRRRLHHPPGRRAQGPGAPAGRRRRCPVPGQAQRPQPGGSIGLSTGAVQPALVYDAARTWWSAWLARDGLAGPPRESRTVYRPPLLAWALLLAPVSALAAEPLRPVDRAYLSIGHYRSANDLTGRWDAADGSLGTRFGFQRDLGFDDAHQALHWNAGLAIGGERRHKLEFFGYRYDDTSQRSIERSLQIGDEGSPIHASLAGNLDVDIQGLSYTWFFLQDGRQAMGFGLGAVRYDLGLGLVASLQVQDESVTVRQRLREHAWAPLLRVEYVRSLSPHWRWGVAAAYVTKPGGEIT